MCAVHDLDTRSDNQLRKSQQNIFDFGWFLKDKGLSTLPTTKEGIEMKTAKLFTITAIALGLFSGCASIDQKSERVPSAGIALQPLKRSQYEIGAPVSAKATVTVERTLLQKLLPGFGPIVIFGKSSVTGDQTYSATLGVSSETSVSGSRGIAVSGGGSNNQLADILASLLGSLGGQLGGSEAVARATEAAYFKALSKNPKADFLLEPRVSVKLKGSSSFLFFVPDSETAEVRVSGKPVTVITD